MVDASKITSSYKPTTQAEGRIFMSGIAEKIVPRVPKGQALEPGKMYLQLYHGRKTIDEQLEDWGDTGPVLGPLTDFVGTYMGHLRVFWGGPDWPQEAELAVAAEMIHFEGMYYGDFSIFVAHPDKHPKKGT